MKTIVKRMYEGLFLVDSGEAAADWQAVTGVIERILTRNGAEIISLRKWDERRLAYEIGKKSRGTYILVYFNCDASRIAAIERDVRLSESIMRVLILRTDKMRPEDIAKPTPAMAAESAEAAAAARDAETEAEAGTAEEPAEEESGEDVEDEQEESGENEV
ncbi:MAG TPA: 30S ribosomal protein S6 [Anaerohalosphaeraceae bacterium]|nr:30S ribosomal protein S6 [Anaerohalosphaeraceae bacterium]HRT49005.1 30S ribosomal protein S6 [Anaerohalosphaeraceae bacterium]HRT85128.1 30S ribosomal protein S6 [Anaerohalosphaeraceae bacterium]